MPPQHASRSRCAAPCTAAPLRIAAALAALLALSSAPRAAHAARTTLQRSAPLTTVDPQAVCNDGSSAFYYFTSAINPQLATVWVVYLEGGEWCYNRTTCAERHAAAPWLMSSASWPPSQALGGVFDSDQSRNALAGANLAYVPYCTSDAYAGDAAASDDTFGWAFRGSHVLPAVLSALASQHGMGSTGGPERALLGGCGTGGLGAMLSLDFATEWVPSNVMLHGLLDAALLLDLAPVTAGAAMPLPEQAGALYRLVNASGRAWPECEDTYGGAGADAWGAWRCIYGVYRLPFVRVSYLMAQPQYEATQLRADEGGAAPPYPPASRAAAYAQKFGQAMRQQLATYPRGNQQGSAVFAPACYAGCLTSDGGYFTMAVPNSGRGGAATTLADALRSWYFDGLAPLRVVESCADPRLNCGVCHNRTAHALRLAAAAARPSTVAAPPSDAGFHPTKSDMVLATITSVLLLLGAVIAAIECTPGGSAAASAALADAPRLLQERLRAEWAFQEAGLPLRQPLPDFGGPPKGSRKGGNNSEGEGTAMRAIARAHASSSAAAASLSTSGPPPPLPPLPLLPSAGGVGYGATDSGLPPPVQLQTASGRAKAAAAVVRTAAANARVLPQAGPSAAAAATQEGLVSEEEEEDAPVRPVRRSQPRAAAPPLPPAPAPPRARGRASDDEGAGTGRAARSKTQGGDSDWRFPGMAPAGEAEDGGGGGAVGGSAPAGGGEDDDVEDGPPGPTEPAPARDPLRRASSSGTVLGLRSPVGGGRLRAASSSKRLAPANARQARDDDL